MGNGICYVCNKVPGEREANVTTGFEWVDVECLRCGKYKAATDWFEDQRDGNNSIPLHTALRLSAMIREHTDRKQRQRFVLNYEIFDGLPSVAPPKLSYAASIERILIELARTAEYPGMPTQPFAVAELAARVELPDHVAHTLVQQLAHQGLIGINAGSTTKKLDTSLNPNAWERIDELQASRPRSDRVFVAMWFDPSMANAYNLGIEPALLACGYAKPFRVDDLEHQKDADTPEFQLKIDDRIIAGIRQARFVVVDVTGMRPAVYYEAGFAEGLGTPVIWTCKKDVPEHMNFDTRQKEHILWTDAADLAAQLEVKIRARGWNRT